MTNDHFIREKLSSVDRIESVMERQAEGELLVDILNDLNVKRDAFRTSLRKYGGKLVSEIVICDIAKAKEEILQGRVLDPIFTEKIINEDDERLLQKMKKVAPKKKLIVRIDDNITYCRLHTLEALQYIKTELLTTFSGHSKLLITIIK